MSITVIAYVQKRSKVIHGLDRDFLPHALLRRPRQVSCLTDTYRVKAWSKHGTGKPDVVRSRPWTTLNCFRTSGVLDRVEANKITGWQFKFPIEFPKFKS